MGSHTETEEITSLMPFLLLQNLLAKNIWKSLSFVLLLTEKEVQKVANEAVVPVKFRL